MGAVPGGKQQGAHFNCKYKDSSWSCLKSHCYYLLVYFSPSKRRTMWKKTTPPAHVLKNIWCLYCFVFLFFFISSCQINILRHYINKHSFFLYTVWQQNRVSNCIVSALCTCYNFKGWVHHLKNENSAVCHPLGEVSGASDGKKTTERKTKRLQTMYSTGAQRSQIDLKIHQWHPILKVHYVV